MIHLCPADPDTSVPVLFCQLSVPKSGLYIDLDALNPEKGWGVTSYIQLYGDVPKISVYFLFNFI